MSKQEVITAEEFRKKHGKKPRRRKNFNGEAAIKERLTAIGLAFETQYYWHPTRKFRSDFAIIARTNKVLIEFEGGVHLAKSGHSGHAIEDNCLRQNEATALGYKMLRLTTGMMKKRGYFEDILRRTLQN